MEEIDKKISSLLKEAENFANDIDEKIAFVEESMALLENMKETLDPAHITENVITGGLDTVRHMAVRNRELEVGNLLSRTNIQYSPGAINTEMIDRLCGLLQYSTHNLQGPSAAFLVSKPKKQLNPSDYRLTGMYRPQTACECCPGLPTKQVKILE